MTTEETTYTPIEINEYLQRPKIKDLPQETKDEIVEVRTNWEYMSFDMYRQLRIMGIVKKVLNLKYPRSLFTKGEEIVFFDTYQGKFRVCGNFKNQKDETCA